MSALILLAGGPAPPALPAPPEPRPYQKRDLSEIARRDRSVARLLYVAFTGTGKTQVAAWLIQQWLAAGDRVLFLVHRQPLMGQADRALQLAGIAEDKIGWVWRKHPRTSIAAPIQVASLDTLILKKHREKRPQGITRIVIDEAHHAPAAKWQRVLSRYPKARVLGLTATPERLDGEPLQDVFEDMIVSELPEELIARGWLSKPEFWTRPDGWRPDTKGWKKRRGDWRAEDIERALGGRWIVGDMMAHWKKHAGGTASVGFAATVEQATRFCGTFSKAGFASECVFGSTSAEERAAIFNRLLKGATKVVWTCDALGEGWDFPAVRCVILATVTASRGRFLQWCGRCMRPGAPSVVLDHAGNFHSHGLPWWDQEWDLHRKRPRRESIDRRFEVGVSGQVRELAQAPGELVPAQSIERQAVCAGPVAWADMKDRRECPKHKTPPDRAFSPDRIRSRSGDPWRCASCAASIRLKDFNAASERMRKHWQSVSPRERRAFALKIKRIWQARKESERSRITGMWQEAGAKARQKSSQRRRA